MSEYRSLTCHGLPGDLRSAALTTQVLIRSRDGTLLTVRPSPILPHRRLTPVLRLTDRGGPRPSTGERGVGRSAEERKGR